MVSLSLVLLVAAGFNLPFVILILAAVCFLLAAFGVGASRVNLVALGLLLWLLVTMFAKV